METVAGRRRVGRLGDRLRKRTAIAGGGTAWRNASRHERLLRDRDFRAIERLRHQVVESVTGALRGRTGRKVPGIADVQGNAALGGAPPFERKRSCPEER